MKRSLFVALFAVLPFASLSAGAGGKDGDPAIQGTWLASTGELGGKKYPDDILKTLKLVIKDDKYTVTVGGKPDKGTIKVDRPRNPGRSISTAPRAPTRARHSWPSTN